MSEVAEMKFSPIKTIKLKERQDISEAWIQDVIFNNPSLLGLGKVYGHSKERMQPSGGRLDLLYQDEEGNTL